MTSRSARRRTGDTALDRHLAELLETVGATSDVDLSTELLVTTLRMATDDVDRLDRKIASAALAEMREAFRVFGPYRHVPKVTIFGSARTRPADPLYAQARDLAARLAGAGWMVVTGAGPGIMAAGAEGAGADRSLGVNISLPFEQVANPLLATDPKLVVMKYFFTRKLMLMKESAGFAVLPGGFGTLDETFELLTLLQTGKAAPAPLVLLDVPGGTYWQAFSDFLHAEVATRGLIAHDDLALGLRTDDVAAAAREILGFFRNYHSLRHVGSKLVLRLRAEPTAEEVAELNRDFADIVVEGAIERVEALPPEVAGGDHLELPRLALTFDRMAHGRLRQLVDALNRLGSAPGLAVPEPGSASAAGALPDEDTGSLTVLDPDLAERVEAVGAARHEPPAARRRAHEALRATIAAVADPDQRQAARWLVAELVAVETDDDVRADLLASLGSGVGPEAVGPVLDLVLQLVGTVAGELGRASASALATVLGSLLDVPAGTEAHRRAILAVHMWDVRDDLGTAADRLGGPAADALDGVVGRLDRLRQGARGARRRQAPPAGGRRAAGPGR